ncbi:MAG: Hsp20/alpha crystallin family protein [Candidatus Lokiarchaeota archaeon]|nr:Hsp20/alpha crystallin family protein [Candidatus Lokiarchaeota archaeon]
MSEDKKIEIKKENIKEKTPEGNKKARELVVRRENPFSLFQEMDRLFDDLNSRFFDDFYWPFNRRRRPLTLEIMRNEPLFRTPLANISEEKDFFNITAELPGLDKADIDITIQDDHLEIKGELKEEKKEEDKDGSLIRREYKSSSYYRCFNLPENIDKDKIDASLEKGLLKIKIPKVEPKKPEKKKIDVK